MKYLIILLLFAASGCKMIAPKKKDTPNIKKTLLLDLRGEEINAAVEKGETPIGTLKAPTFLFEKDNQGVERLSGVTVNEVRVMPYVFPLILPAEDKCFAYDYAMKTQEVSNEREVEYSECRNGIIEKVDSWLITTRQVILFLYQLGSSLIG